MQETQRVRMNFLETVIGGVQKGNRNPRSWRQLLILVIMGENNVSKRSKTSFSLQIARFLFFGLQRSINNLHISSSHLKFFLKFPGFPLGFLIVPIEKEHESKLSKTLSFKLTTHHPYRIVLYDKLAPTSSLYIVSLVARFALHVKCSDIITGGKQDGTDDRIPSDLMQTMD